MVKTTQLLCGLLVLGLLFAEGAESPPPPVFSGAEEIDTRIVLRVGPVELSAYAIEKNVNRFRAGARPDKTPPSGAELRDWFGLFLAQQVIIAEAARAGYLERAEVTAMVERMETHMLTQTQGPFYASLLGAEPSAEELAAMYAKTGRLKDVLIARFEDATAAERRLGADFAAQTSEEKLRRLEGARGDGGVMWHEGPIAWPYEPFGDAGDVLDELEGGEWHDGFAGQQGHHVIFVRRIDRRPLPDFAGERDAFARLARLAQTLRFQRNRRANFLESARFSFDAAAGGRLAAALREVRSETGEIAAEAVATIAEEPLFSFELNGSRRVVTVRAYADRFNARFVRQFVPAVAAIRENAIEMALAEFDLQEARARGIHEEPKFREDRKNFTYYQALDLYEKEKLRPRLDITDEAVAARYEATRESHRRVSKVAMQRHVFADLTSANAFIAQQRPAGPLRAAMVSPMETTEWVIDRGQALNHLEFLKEAFLQSPQGRSFGPFPEGNRQTVLVRGATVATEIAPLAEVAAEVRRQLERAALDAREIELARTLARTMKIEDRIDYGRHGVEGAVAAPWRG